MKISVTRPTFLLATREFHNKAASWRRKLRSPLAPVNSICVAISYLHDEDTNVSMDKLAPTANASAKLGTQGEVVNHVNVSLPYITWVGYKNYACPGLGQKNCCRVVAISKTLIDNVSRWFWRISLGEEKEGRGCSERTEIEHSRERLDSMGF